MPTYGEKTLLKFALMDYPPVKWDKMGATCHMMHFKHLMKVSSNVQAH